MSGARFVVLRQGLARLERALGQFMLDMQTLEHGYTEVSPPLLVRDNAMFGVGQLAQVRRGHVSHHRRPLADLDGGGLAHQPGARADSVGGASTAAV